MEDTGMNIALDAIDEAIRETQAQVAPLQRKLAYLESARLALQSLEAKAAGTEVATQTRTVLAITKAGDKRLVVECDCPAFTYTQGDRTVGDRAWCKHIQWAKTRLFSTPTVTNYPAYADKLGRDYD